jgi:hypothetical protein
VGVDVGVGGGVSVGVDVIVGAVVLVGSELVVTVKIGGEVAVAWRLIKPASWRQPIISPINPSQSSKLPNHGKRQQK